MAATAANKLTLPELGDGDPHRGPGRSARTRMGRLSSGGSNTIGTLTVPSQTAHRMGQPRRVSHTAVVTIDRHDLIDSFGQALLDGTGALFVGAGMSLNAGLPTWADLLRDVRTAAKVPDMSDLPLMAEYIVNDPKIEIGRAHV